jgi:hypothetical protein
VHLAEIPLGRLFREVERLPVTELVATSEVAHDGVRQDLTSAAGDRDLLLLAMRRHDVAKMLQPIDVVAQVA